MLPYCVVGREAGRMRGNLEHGRYDLVVVVEDGDEDI